MWSLDKWIIPNPEETLFCLSCYKENNNKLCKEGACKNMKDVLEIFDENLKAMIGMLEDGNIKGCTFVTSNLCIFSSLAEYKEGVMISETLNGVIYEIGPILDEEIYSVEEKISGLSRITKPLKKIIESYQKPDKSELYNALKEIRVQATQMQIQGWKGVLKQDLNDIKEK